MEIDEHNDLQYFSAAVPRPAGEAFGTIKAHVKD
jgi:hypothetical protein